MSKPIVNKITSFDATKDNNINFTYLGNMPYRNRLIIGDASDLSIIYDQIATTTTMYHTLFANTLINGKKYYAQIQVYEKDGSVSSISDKVYFYAYTTPAFYFKNVTGLQKVTAASLYAQLIYAQIELEDLVQYRFYLYDSGKTLLSQSEMFYSSQNMTYQYRGLENDTVYYIRAVGATRHEIQMDTGYIQIYVSYENHEKYSMVFADCDNNTSIVTYHTRFIIIQASDDSYFSYNNGLIDLRGKSLTYDTGFALSGDFTITIRGIYMYHTDTVLTFNDGNYTGTLSSRIYDDGTMRYKLSVPNGLCNYVIYSDPVTPSDDQMVTVNIRRINNVYSLTVFVNDYDGIANYWFGNSKPSTFDLLTSYDVWINTDNSTIKVDSDNMNILVQNDEPDISQSVDYGTVWIKEV